MASIFKLPTPIVQSIGLICVPVGDPAKSGWIERKPVAAAVLTLSQRDDEHIHVFAETMSAVDEQQFPLPWLIEQELVTGSPTLISPAERALLITDAAQARHFVEPKIAQLMTDGEFAIDVAALAQADGGWCPDEMCLFRRLGIPHCEPSETEAARVWTWYPQADRAPLLREQALSAAVSRLMLWSNLMAVREAEPGWFYEPMLALRSWLNEQENDRPELYAWSTSKPIMRAASFVQEYRHDLDRRLAGEPSSWPQFEKGLFHC